MTPKPSSTNCPPALSVSSSLTWFYGSSVIHLSRRPFWGVRLFLVCLDVSFTKTYSGGYSSGAPPLPIPNREVKPGRADGTAPQCGRVGRRRFLPLPSSGTICSSGGEVFLWPVRIFRPVSRLFSLFSCKRTCHGATFAVAEHASFLDMMIQMT